MVQRTILAQHQYKLVDILSANDINLSVQYLEKIYQNLEEGNGTSIKDIKYYVDKTIKNLNSEESLVFNSLFLRSINSCYPSLRMILNSSQ